MQKKVRDSLAALGSRLYGLATRPFAKAEASRATKKDEWKWLLFLGLVRWLINGTALAHITPVLYAGSVKALLWCGVLLGLYSGVLQFFSNTYTAVLKGELPEAWAGSPFWTSEWLGQVRWYVIECIYATFAESLRFFLGLLRRPEPGKPIAPGAHPAISGFAIFGGAFLATLAQGTWDNAVKKISSPLKRDILYISGSLVSVTALLLTSTQLWLIGFGLFVALGLGGLFLNRYINK